MLKYFKKPVGIGALIGLIVTGAGVLISITTEVDVGYTLPGRAVIFLFIAPYLLFNYILSLASVTIPDSIQYIHWIFIFIYWSALGGILGWLAGSLHPIRKLLAGMLLLVIILSHAWIAAKWEREMKNMGSAIINSATNAAVKWGPFIEKMIEEQSKNTAHEQNR